MRKVRIDDQEPVVSPASEERQLTDPLEATNLAVNYYVLKRGDSFAYGYHAHEDQEEVFYVQSGTVTFETDDGPVEVGAGEVIRFAPGEHQRGINEHDDPAVALAIGAPRDSGALDLRRECENCGGRTSHRIERRDDGAKVTVCERCGAETGRYT